MQKLVWLTMLLTLFGCAASSNEDTKKPPRNKGQKVGVIILPTDTGPIIIPTIEDK